MKQQCLHALTTKAPNKAQRDSSLSLSRKIASTFLSLSILALPLQAQNPKNPQNTQKPQTTDEKIQQLEKELRLLELQKQIEQAKQSSDKTTTDSSTTSTTQSTTTTQATQDKQTIQYRASTTKSKSYDYGYERSGSFIGVELGYGELLSTVSTNYGVLKERDGGFKYGLLLGYNKFFVKYFGLRFYGNANVTQISDKASGDWLFRLNYGVNLDAIANFLATEYTDFGAFVGIGVGGQTYFFTGQNKEALDVLESNGAKVSYTSFDAGLNVGLRTNIIKHLGIEVAARVPFVKHNLFEVKGAYVLKETYSISARILWNY